MRILIVDDEAGKRAQVRDYIREKFASSETWEARSVQSAVELLRQQTFDLVVLDMRLTTYDASAADAGGRPRNFGGEEIMRKMERRSIAHPVIVLTQYTMFDDQGEFYSFHTLGERLRANYRNFVSMIHFSQSNSKWKAELSAVIHKLCEVK